MVPKSVLGESGNLDGVDIVRILARRKETAERLALKLIRFFCVDNLDGGYVDKVAQAVGQSSDQAHAQDYFYE